MWYVAWRPPWGWRCCWGLIQCWGQSRGAARRPPLCRGPCRAVHRSCGARCLWAACRRAASYPRFWLCRPPRCKRGQALPGFLRRRSRSPRRTSWLPWCRTPLSGKPSSTLWWPLQPMKETPPCWRAPALRRCWENSRETWMRAEKASAMCAGCNIWCMPPR